MQLCTSPQTDNHASTHHSVFTGWMPFLPPNQQRQSTKMQDISGILVQKVFMELNYNVQHLFQKQHAKI